MQQNFKHSLELSKQKKRKKTYFAIFIITLIYIASGYVTEFSLSTIIDNAPYLSDYFKQIIPHLSIDNLFLPRDSEGYAIPGSLIYWGYRLPIQLPLIWETINMAFAATFIATVLAIIFSFLGAKNTKYSIFIRQSIRTISIFMRTMPELAWAIMFVMAFGVGPFPGFLALTIHSLGCLTKLFYEEIESCEQQAINGLSACGATHFQLLRYGYWPQIKPRFLSYAILRLELNFRASSILGIVGAGGIGQELITNIKLDRFDQISMTLLLIFAVVVVLDAISDRLQQQIINPKPKALKIRRRPSIKVGEIITFTAIISTYYLFFFHNYGVSEEMFFNGSSKLGQYFGRMLIWRDFTNWPFGYYFRQLLITLGIVIGGSLTSSILALIVSFISAKNIMSGRFVIIPYTIRMLVNITRSIDIAVWGMIFVRAIGLGPLAGVLALIVQDFSLLTKLYAEAHEAVDPKPSKGLLASGASRWQQIRFGIFSQSLPTFISLTMYQIESNVRSAAILGFVGAGGIGLVYTENMRLWNWDVVTFITLCLMLIVMLLEKIKIKV